jgi:hypothetical protein
LNVSIDSKRVVVFITRPSVNEAELQAAFEVQRTLVLVLDLCGTLAFALSGAMAGIRRNLDVFGVLVLSFAASTFGGIGRDVLVGATPPAALVDWRYLAVSLAAGLIAFFWSSLIERLRNPVRLLDAVGLAFFAVAGTQKALAFGLSPVMAALMGMLTGVGGASSATCSSLRFLRCCVQISMPSRRLPGRPSWQAAACRYFVLDHRGLWRRNLLWPEDGGDPTRMASPGGWWKKHTAFRGGATNSSLTFVVCCARTCPHAFQILDYLARPFYLIRA